MCMFLMLFIIFFFLTRGNELKIRILNYLICSRQISVFDQFYTHISKPNYATDLLYFLFLYIFALSFHSYGFQKLQTEKKMKIVLNSVRYMKSITPKPSDDLSENIVILLLTTYRIIPGQINYFTYFIY